MLKKNLHKCFGGIKCLPTSNPLTIEDDYEFEYKADESYEEEDRKESQQQQQEEEEQEEQEDEEEEEQEEQEEQEDEEDEEEEEEEEEELLKSSSNSLPIIDLSNTITTTTTSEPFSSSSNGFSSNEFSFESEHLDGILYPDPNFTTVIAASSRRFFISSPGRTNSILDSSTYPTETNHTCYDNNSGGMRSFNEKVGRANSPTVVEVAATAKAEESSTTGSTSSSSNIYSISSSGNERVTVVGGGVAVRKNSPDPYMDFRTSMEEMVEAERGTRERKDYNNNNNNDWEYLHELLLCYLSLNPKDTHKYIIGAFIDLLLTLIAPDDNNNDNN